MANARTAFDALVAVLLEAPDVRVGSVNGKRALYVEADPFLLLHRDALALRLHGHALVKARALEGSIDFDPWNPEEATMSRAGWVRLPASTLRHWPALAQESLRCVRDARWKVVSWDVPTAPTARSAQQLAAAERKRDELAKRARVGLEWGFSFALEPQAG